MKEHVEEVKAQKFELKHRLTTIFVYLIREINDQSRNRTN